MKHIEQTQDQDHGMRLHNNFVQAIFSLSVDAKKILLAVLSYINGNNGKNIKIYRTDIYEKIGIDLKELNSRHREELIEELMKTIVTIRDINNSDNWVKIQLLGKTRYKSGYLETNIDEDLMPYMLEAQERLFTKFNIHYIKPLTSMHAIRIYLIAKQFADTGWYQVDIDLLKRMLEVENKYPRIYDFKKHVLEVAKKQINANTDINIDYELIKQGRKYTKIRLKISKNKQRIDRKENKKLIENGKYAELEAKLNKELKNKTLKGTNGLSWYVKSVKILNDKDAEIEITDLQNEQTITRKIDELPNLFGQN